MKLSTFAVPAALVLVAAVAIAPLARAEAPTGLGVGTWEGQGTSHEVGGAERGTFRVSLKRTATAEGSRTEGRVTLASGKEITFWQNLESKGGGSVRITSNTGKGGGQCFANGMCQLYEVRASDGHAFATTLAKDGERGLRILVTELEGTRALRFYEQTLEKKD